MKWIWLGILTVLCVTFRVVAADLPETSAGTHALPAAVLMDIQLAAASADAGRWRVHRSDHFQIIHSLDSARAAGQARLLERTYQRFFEVFSGFGLHPTSGALTCLLFQSKHDYLGYAQRVDQVDMSWTVAYYSARTNRIAFYRYGGLWDAPAAAAGNRSAATREAYGSASAAGEEGSSLEQAGAAESVRVRLASATHEAAHQLAFNTGLQRRGVRYPLWVSEGLATNFEMSGGDARLGPDRANPSRCRRLARLVDRGQITPLMRFITVTRPPTRDARATDAMYAQAWGLFRFLYQHRRGELAAYLDALYDLPPGERDESTLRAEFERAFGPVQQVGAAWRGWIGELKD